MIRTIIVAVALLNSALMAQSLGATFTYSFSSYPSLQSGAILAGSLTVNTGSRTSDVHGGYFLGHSAITSWIYTVTTNGTAAYSVSSADINASVAGGGGSLAMYAAPTQFSLIAGASLDLKADPSVPGATISLIYNYDVPQYYSGGIGFGGEAWFNADRSALDSAFPSNPDALASNWVIATAVPEPSTTVLLVVGLVGLIGMCTRRRMLALRTAYRADS